jgi:crotonobetainyl-CoA:carnitine CoA-transferase CaiB-like acyl-CoA transferase
LFLMTRRYEADPVTATFITAGPVAGLFLAGAVLAAVVQLRRS